MYALTPSEIDDEFSATQDAGIIIGMMPTGGDEMPTGVMQSCTNGKPCSIQSLRPGFILGMDGLS